MEQDATKGRIQTNQDSRPTPDPTVLTTQMLQREISSAREILETRMNCIEENVEHARIQIGDRHKAIATEIEHIATLHDAKSGTTNERFHSIDTQFRERDERTQKTAELNQKAIDAALQAQKEAANAQTVSLTASITKTETGFTKEIDGIKVLISTGNKTLDDKVIELTRRLDRGEGSMNGKQENQSQSNWLVGILVVGGLTIISLIMNFIQIAHK